MKRSGARRPIAYRATRFTTTFGLATLVAVLVGLPALPWIMGIVTDMQHVYIDTVPAENEGTYLVTDDGVMQLYRWKVEPNRYPDDAPLLEASRVQEVAIVQDAFSDVADHQLWHVHDGSRVPWGGAVEEGTQLRLALPGPLDAGRYHLVVPTDSMYGGAYHYYFRISASSPTPLEADR